MCHPAEDVAISRKSPLSFPWIPVKVQSVCCAGGYLHTQRTDRRREVISTSYKYQPCGFHIKCKPPNSKHTAPCSNQQCWVWRTHVHLSKPIRPETPSLWVFLAFCLSLDMTLRSEHPSRSLQPIPVWLRVISVDWFLGRMTRLNRYK